MATLPGTDRPTTSAAADTLAVLRDLCRDIDAPHFAVRLWDGTTWSPRPDVEPRITLLVRTPAALRRLLRPSSEAALAGAYLVNELDIEGDIFAAPALAAGLLGRRRGWRERLRIAAAIARLPGTADVAADDGAAAPEANYASVRDPLARDRAAVRHHYDISNRFYELFLDPAMVYTCAVFDRADEDLATAQRRKLDLICRKLRLREGQKLLDVGCGWGALILHAAREYGVDATGITLATRQAELARERIARAGLSERCRVEIRDYRELDGEARFDAIASVGMFEHVGRAKAPAYFDRLFEVLRPGGAYLHHAINFTPRGYQPGGGPTFTTQFVFPENELMLLNDTIGFAEAAGFETRDVENLREHYALTLRQWIAGLERNRDAAIEEVGDPTWRAWRLVFAGAVVRFERGLSALNQVLFVRPNPDGGAGLPLTRRDWYAA